MGRSAYLPVCFEQQPDRMKIMKGVSAAMSAAHSKNQAARQIWLLYFNRALLERGVITEQEHNRMKIKIQSRTVGRKEDPA